MRLSISLNFTIALDGHKLFTRTSWGRLRKQAKKRDGAICQYCNEPAPDGEVDHIIPLSKGGLDVLDNLVWSCRSCNNSKGNKTLEEWRATAAQGATTLAEDKEREQHILDLVNEGLSGRQIQIEVFGYTGGAAYEAVARALKSDKPVIVARKRHDGEVVEL